MSNSLKSLLLLLVVQLLFVTSSSLSSATQISVNLNSNAPTLIPCNNINNEYFLNGNATNSLIYCQEEGTANCALSRIIFNGTSIFNSTVQLRFCRINLGVFVLPPPSSLSTTAMVENTKFDLNNLESYGAIRLDFAVAKNVEVLFWKNRLQDDQNTRGQSASNFSFLWRNNESSENVSFYAYENTISTYPERSIGFHVLGNHTSRIGKINISANTITTGSFNAISVRANSTTSSSNDDSLLGGFTDGIYIQGNTVRMTGIGQTENDEFSTAVEFVMGSSSNVNRMPTKGILIENNNITFSETKTGNARAIYIQPRGDAAHPLDASSLKDVTESGESIVEDSSCLVLLSSNIIIQNNRIDMKNGTRFSAQGISLARAHYCNGSRLVIQNNIVSTNSSGIQSAINVSVCSRNSTASFSSSSSSSSQQPQSNIVKIHNNNLNVVAQSGSRETSGCTFILERGFVSDDFNFTSNAISIMTTETNNTDSFFPIQGLQVLFRNNATMNNFYLMSSTINIQNSAAGSASKLVSIFEEQSSMRTSHSPIIGTVRVTSNDFSSSTSSSSSCPSIGFHINVTVLKDFIMNSSNSINLSSARGTNQTNSSSENNKFYHICPPSNGGLIIQKGRSINLTRSLLSAYFPQDEQRYKFLKMNSNNTFNVHLKDLTVSVKNCSESQQGQEYPSRGISIDDDDENSQQQHGSSSSATDESDHQQQQLGSVHLGQVTLENPLTIEVSSEKDKCANMIGVFISSTFFPTANSGTFVKVQHAAISVLSLDGVLNSSSAAIERTLSGFVIADTLNVSNRNKTSSNAKSQTAASPPTIGYISIIGTQINVNFSSSSSVPSVSACISSSSSSSSAHIKARGIVISNISVPATPDNAIEISGSQTKIDVAIENVNCWSEGQVFQALGIVLELDPTQTAIDTHLDKTFVFQRVKVSAQILFRKPNDSSLVFALSSRRAFVVTHAMRIVLDTNLNETQLTQRAEQYQNWSTMDDASRNASAEPLLFFRFLNSEFTSNASSSSSALPEDIDFLPNSSIVSIQSAAQRRAVSSLFERYPATFYEEMMNPSSALSILASSSLELTNKTTNTHVYYPRTRFELQATTARCQGQKCFGVLATGAVNMTYTKFNSHKEAALSRPGLSLTSSTISAIGRDGASSLFIGGLFIDTVSLFSVSPSSTFNNAFPIATFRILIQSCTLYSHARDGSSHASAAVLGDFNITNYQIGYDESLPGSGVLSFNVALSTIESRGGKNVTASMLTTGDRFERSQEQLPVVVHSSVSPIMKQVRFWYSDRSHFRVVSLIRSDFSSTTTLMNNNENRILKTVLFTTPQTGIHIPILGIIETNGVSSTFRISEELVSIVPVYAHQSTPSTLSDLQNFVNSSSLAHSASCVSAEFADLYTAIGETIPSGAMRVFNGLGYNLMLQRFNCNISLPNHAIQNHTRAVDIRGAASGAAPRGFFSRLLISNPAIEIDSGSKTSSFTIPSSSSLKRFSPSTIGIFVDGNTSTSSPSSSPPANEDGNMRSFETMIFGAESAWWINIKTNGMENVRALQFERCPANSTASNTFDFRNLRVNITQKCCGSNDEGVFKLSGLGDTGRRLNFINNSVSIAMTSNESDSAEVSARKYSNVTLLTVPAPLITRINNISSFAASVGFDSSTYSEPTKKLLHKISLINITSPIDGPLNETLNRTQLIIHYPVLDTPNAFYENGTTKLFLFGSQVRASNPVTSSQYYVEITCPVFNGEYVSSFGVESLHFSPSSFAVDSRRHLMFIECSMTHTFSRSKSGSVDVSQSRSMTDSPTPDQSASLSSTQTFTKTPPPTPTMSFSKSFTADATATESRTVTPPPTPTATFSRTNTLSYTVTPPPTPTATFSGTKTVTFSLTPPPTPSATFSQSKTSTFSLTLPPTPSQSISRSGKSPSSSHSTDITASESNSEVLTFTKTITPISLTKTWSKSRTASLKDTLSRSEIMSPSESGGTLSATPSHNETPSSTRSAIDTFSHTVSSSQTAHITSLTLEPTPSNESTHSETPPSQTLTGLTRSINFTFSISRSGLSETHTSSVSHNQAEPVTIIDIMEGSPTAVSIAGGIAALASPMGALDAARQITNLELLQCGGESGGERNDVRAVVPFPLSLLPRFGFGDAEGRYLRGAVVSHALLCLVLIALFLIVGFIRSHLFISSEAERVKRAGGNISASPFLEWYLRFATWTDKIRLRIFFGKIPAAVLLILTVPIGLASIVLGTLIAAPSISSAESFACVCVVLAFLGFVLYVFLQIKGWIDMQDAKGHQPGAGTIFVAKSIIYNPHHDEISNNLQNTACRFMTSVFGRWLLMGNHFWLDETHLSNHYPGQVPREDVEQNFGGGVNFESDNLPTPQNDFLFVFMGRPVLERYGVLCEKFFGPIITERIRDDGARSKGEAELIRSHSRPTITQTWGWRMFFIAAFAVVISAILVGAARVRPQFCHTAAILNIVFNALQFLFVVVTQPYIVGFRNALAIVLETVTFGSAIAAFAFLRTKEEDDQTRATLAGICQVCTWIATACLIIQLLHFITRRSLMMFSGAMMKTRLQLWIKLADELDDKLNPRKRREREIQQRQQQEALLLKKKIEEQEKSLGCSFEEQQELAIIGGSSKSILKSNSNDSNEENTNNNTGGKNTSNVSVVGGVLLPKQAHLPHHLQHIHSLTTDAPPRNPDQYLAENNNNSNKNDNKNDKKQRKQEQREQRALQSRADAFLSGMMKMAMGDDNLGHDEDHHYMKRPTSLPKKIIGPDGRETNRYEIQPHNYYFSSEQQPQYLDNNKYRQDQDHEQSSAKRRLPPHLESLRNLALGVDEDDEVTQPRRIYDREEGLVELDNHLYSSFSGNRRQPGNFHDQADSDLDDDDYDEQPEGRQQQQQSRLTDAEMRYHLRGINAYDDL